MEDLQIARDAADNGMLNGVEGDAAAKAAAANKLLAANSDALQQTQASTAGGKADLDEMSGLIDGTMAHQAAVVEAEKKHINERAAIFTADLMDKGLAASLTQTKEGADKVETPTEQLLRQAAALENEHEQLNNRHEAAGERITHLYSKLGEVLNAQDTKSSLIAKAQLLG